MVVHVCMLENITMFCLLCFSLVRSWFVELKNTMLQIKKNGSLGSAWLLSCLFVCGCCEFDHGVGWQQTEIKRSLFCKLTTILRWLQLLGCLGYSHYLYCVDVKEECPSWCSTKMLHFCLEKLSLCIRKSELLFTLFCVFSCILMERMIGSRGSSS